ncbi:unnamed protein product [Mytilus coruscus]|uniref:Uncharacterized protein n=1 Tax=Mytilus coruscus TaxID=42192 RepID=A0A6J8E1G5_MYTCO|nr:unnamed protein product [Mytilus coruscus]
MDNDTLDLKQSLEKYTKKSDDYISFLTHTKTAEATSELEEHTKFREDFVYKVEGLIRSSIAETTGFRPKSTLKEPSVKSQKKTSKKSLSKASLRSSNSSVLRQKAKDFCRNCTPSQLNFKPSNLPTTKETGQTIKHLKQEDVNNNVDFAKFLMKKDLLTSRFHKFDDCPENYVSWKNTFKCV